LKPPFPSSWDPEIYPRWKQETPVIILGLILLIIGFVAKIAILWTIGIIVLVVGLILALLGATGRAIGGRRHYW
jgi:multisubunit Na+/H+ antiporter MnhG subunit